MTSRRFLPALLTGALLFTSAAHADAARAPNSESHTWCAARCDRVVTDWNATAFRIIEASDASGDPMSASRSLAMMHLAMHDAANTVHSRFQRYALAEPPVGTREADAAVAASIAAHDVLVALYPREAATSIAKLQLERTLFEAGHGTMIDAGTRIGRAAAAAVLARRADDGAHVGVAGAQSRHVKPFVLVTAYQFRTAAPPAVSNASHESRHAGFAREFSGIEWNRAARAAAGSVEQDLWERARTFALLNMALADAYIASSDSKFHHNFWRPVTVTSLASSDGTLNAGSGASLDPQLVTPAEPDMPSTHSALAAAAAVVLADAFGSGQVSMSFRFTTESGLELGSNIGQYVNRYALARQYADGSFDD